MKRFLVLAAMAVLVGSSDGQSPTSKDKTTPYMVKLPIPDVEITANLSLWKGSFSISKVTYDKDTNEVVFVLKALREFSFKDDGFESIKFFDEDGVDLIKKKNVKFDPEPKGLKMGEATRARLKIPDDDVLKKTQKCTAVASGFFMK